MNSSNQRTEYASFKREVLNPMRSTEGMVKKFQDKSSRMELFNEWFYNGKNVQKLDVLIKRVETFKRILNESMGFRTRDDLIKMYHKKADKVDDLIGRKVRLGHWRPHPEFRTDNDMIQYWVRLDTSMQSQHITMDAMELQLLTQIDAGDMQDFCKDMAIPGLKMTDDFDATMNPQEPDAAPPTPGPEASGSGGKGQKRKRDGAKKGAGGDANAQRVLPDDPLKKGQALVKAIEKYRASLQSLTLRLASGKSQAPLIGKLNDICTEITAIYNDLTKLTKEKVNEEGPYDAIVQRYHDLKTDAEEDVAEAEAVSAGMMRPSKKAGAGAAQTAKAEP